MSRRLLPVLILPLLAACSSETTDPAANTTADTGTTPDTMTQSDAATGMDSGSTDTASQTDVGGGDDAGPSEDTAGSDAVADAADDTATDTAADAATDSGGTEDVAPAVCELASEFTGQVDIEATSEPDGGAPRFTPYDASYDAGLDDVVAAFPSEDEEVAATVTVTGATVVATNFYSDFEVPPNRTLFWIADGNESISVNLDFRNPDQDFPDFPIRVGSTISFETVTLRRSFGTPSIRQATNWELVDVGQEVYIKDITEPMTADDISSLVRVHGTLTGEPECCDSAERCAPGSTSRPNQCWDLAYLDGAETVRFRSNSAFLETGDCITFVGPVSDFNGSPQLQSSNFDWVFEPF